jgi:hypothetical protein
MVEATARQLPTVAIKQNAIGGPMRSELEEDPPMNKYMYGQVESLEAGEAAPEYAKHPDVELRDEGWDKIERVHHFAYVTENQAVAREHGFALLVIEEDDEVPCSWGTFDCEQIEADQYEYEDGTPVDIYTDEGARAAIAADEHEREEHAVEVERLEAEQKKRIDAENAELAKVLTGAGIEPTSWDLEIARKAKYHVRDERLHAQGQLTWKPGKFSRSYEYTLGQVDEVRQAQRQADALVYEAQQQGNRLVTAAKSRLHNRAQSILQAVRG